MKKIIVLIISLAVLIFGEAIAQNKVVLLDISLEDKSAYLNVSPDIFAHYCEIVENQHGAKFIFTDEDRRINMDAFVQMKL
jgi:hypothetical protein